MYMHVNETLGRVASTKLEEVARACACANLRKAARVVTQLFDGVLAPSGLKATQFTLLVTSRLMGETTVGELALAGAYPLWKRAQEAVVIALGSDRYEALLGDTARTVSLASDAPPEAPAGSS